MFDLVCVFVIRLMRSICIKIVFLEVRGCFLFGKFFFEFLCIEFIDDFGGNFEEKR